MVKAIWFLMSWALGYLVFLVSMQRINPFEKPSDSKLKMKWVMSLYAMLAIGGVLSAPVVGAKELLDFVVIKLAFLFVAGIVGLFVYMGLRVALNRRQ